MSNEFRHGRITTGVPLGIAVIKTLKFIETNLSAWRSDPERPNAVRERELNSQLCKFLNIAAKRCDFAMIHFHHEELQGTRHSADLSANPIDGGIIEGWQYTKYEPILVVECKRLPTLGSNREREYVASPSSETPSGGIQRFKFGLHGAKLDRAGIVGYIQAGTCEDWLATINGWVEELASSHDPLWSADDRLGSFVHDSETRVSRCESEHTRAKSVSDKIRLSHLWVQMLPD